MAGEFAATRDEKATTVAALISLLDETLAWMRARNEQAKQMMSAVIRTQYLALCQGKAIAEHALLLRRDAEFLGNCWPLTDNLFGTLDLFVRVRE